MDSESVAAIFLVVFAVLAFFTGYSISDTYICPSETDNSTAFSSDAQCEKVNNSVRISNGILFSSFVGIFVVIGYGASTQFI